MVLDLLRRPWDSDVLPTENIYGDNISDLAARLIGGMGSQLRPILVQGMRSSNLLTAQHRIQRGGAGQGKANPTSTILSEAVMLGWLGRRHQRGARANLAPYNRARQADAAASMIESTSMLTAL